MANIIVLLIIITMLVAAIRYIVRAKKRGIKCIGCPDAAACSKSQCSAQILARELQILSNQDDDQ